MDKAATDRVEHQVRQVFPEGVIARVQVLQYGDDPEVESGQAGYGPGVAGQDSR